MLLKAPEPGPRPQCPCNFGLVRLLTHCLQGQWEGLLGWDRPVGLGRSLHLSGPWLVSADVKGPRRRGTQARTVCWPLA